MQLDDQVFMQRCFDLAILGAGKTSPNPIVGAVIVHRGRIIGEGYHRAYGQAHAEVNAVNSVQPEDRGLLPYSTIYVSLEPCNIHRNTPPCTLLILRERIPRVVISYLDHSPSVDGSGIERLRAAGVEVVVGVKKSQGQWLSWPRNILVTQNRPFVLLKYAQSANRIFAPLGNEQLWLTNAFSKRLVHKWRSEYDAILVGYRTALADNPRLNNRLYYGSSPVRIVLDRYGSLPAELHLFDGETLTIAVSEGEKVELKEEGRNCKRLLLPFGEGMIQILLQQLARENISSLMVEGGIKTLQAFLKQELWDEARVLQSPRHLTEGRLAPNLPVSPRESHAAGGDQLLVYRNPHSLNLH
jgi:diaminohydroxyphosphoribosylaminopyrimidine deaminase / 5-amino-6-(5-phosphoribosylamino)uracil reductase